MVEFIRIWKNIDINDISGHLLIVGEAMGDCSKCKSLGIDYSSAKTCPECSTEFKYIASRSREVKKIIQKRPDLIFIDFEDYKRVIGKIKAKGLFS